MLLLLIAFGVSGYIKNTLKLFVTHPVARMFGIFFGLFLVGACYSVADSHDVLYMLKKMSKFLCFPIILFLMQAEKWRKRALWAFLGAMLITFFPMKNAFFKDPIYTGLMMAFGSFILAHFFSVYAQKPLVQGLLGLLLVLFTFFVFFINRGRAGYILYGVLALLFVIRQNFIQKRFWIVLGFFVFFAVVCLYSTVLQQRAMDIVRDVAQYQINPNIETSIGARLEYYRHTMALALQHPWFGEGTGSFAVTYAAFAKANQLFNTQNPHNEYLNIFFQFGLMGLTILLTLFGTIYRQLSKVSIPDRWLAEGLLLIVMIGSLANSWLMDFSSSYFFIVLTAVLLGSTLNTQKEFV